MRCLLILMSLVFLMTTQVSATPKYFIGAGTVSCGAWLQARREHRATNMQGWVLGFVSGANASRNSDDFLVDPDGPGLLAWIDNYCPQHPLENLFTASDSLIFELITRAAQAKQGKASQH